MAILPTARTVIGVLKKHVRPDRVTILKSFFKTGPGDYSEGDRFMGVYVAGTRAAAKAGFGMLDREIQKLLDSPWHEQRLAGLLILVNQFQRGDPQEQKRVYTFYMKNLKAVNNWDLVDQTAEHVVGAWCHAHSDRILFDLARSPDLWERRVAMVATLYHIRQRSFTTPLKLARFLLQDTHDLIHKAVGWLLREIGKKDLKVLRDFLNRHADVMPRTMLRYAIERMTPVERQRYMTMGRKRLKKDRRST